MFSLLWLGSEKFQHVHLMGIWDYHLVRFCSSLTFEYQTCYTLSKEHAGKNWEVLEEYLLSYEFFSNCQKSVWFPSVSSVSHLTFGYRWRSPCTLQSVRMAPPTHGAFTTRIFQLCCGTPCALSGTSRRQSMRDVRTRTTGFRRAACTCGYPCLRISHSGHCWRWWPRDTCSMTPGSLQPCRPWHSSAGHTLLRSC